MWVGLDDTDSPKGGCTTWALTEVLREVAEHLPGVDLVGPPRLVRLNPNVPFKTRGNAALGARFGRGRGRPSRVGELRGRPMLAYPAGLELSEEATDALWSAVLRVLGRVAAWGEARTDPAAVLSPRLLPEELYRRAVREEVTPRQALEMLAGQEGTRVAAYGSGQGVVGASSALAWRGRRRTYEAIAYRPSERWGHPRAVDPGSVRAMAARHPETFLSFDPLTRRTMVVPHTPCPVLFGVRARSPEGLSDAVHEIRGEPWERWTLFLTNQASGDHLVDRAAAAAVPGSSGVFVGTVASPPRSLRGGHMVVRIEDPSGSLRCVAFEPTKTLPPVVRRLLPGDRVRVWGSFPWPTDAPSADLALRMEGISVLTARPEWLKEGNPRCPGCDRRMGSKGRQRGFQCPACGRRTPPESATGRWVRRGSLRGSYLPTPSARRHLAPLRAPRSPSSSIYNARRT